jgi:ADP-ribose pyrophosphatase YjhB (NUDIX family)
VIGERDARRAGRETWRVLADLVSQEGELEVVHRRWECPPDVRDRLVENLDRVGILGGAGALVRRQCPDGDRPETLLVRYDDGDGWSDPGANLEPGESFHECAERAVEATTGLRVTVSGVLQSHVLYADDWTDRDPIPHPFVLFEALYGEGTAEPQGSVGAVEWFLDPPAELRYGELRDAF